MKETTEKLYNMKCSVCDQFITPSHQWLPNTPDCLTTTCPEYLIHTLRKLQQRLDHIMRGLNQLMIAQAQTPNISDVSARLKIATKATDKAAKITGNYIYSIKEERNRFETLY